MGDNVIYIAPKNEMVPVNDMQPTTDNGGGSGGGYITERVAALEINVVNIKENIQEIKQGLRSLHSKVDSNLKWLIGTMLLLFGVTMTAFYHLSSKIDQMDTSLSNKINVLSNQYTSLNDKVNTIANGHIKPSERQ